jgi:ribulose-5-phosphate 4-epimerase/fuculose-1-phosphate aldolase
MKKTLAVPAQREAAMADFTGELTQHADAPVAPMTDVERQLRQDLAAGYRLAAQHGWTDVIYTHISVRVPGPEHHFLINPFGLMFEEITASSLVKIDLNGQIVDGSPHPVNAAGFVIHSAVHMSRDDAQCVMHLHTDEGVALSMMGEGLLPLSQHAMMFFNRVAYHDYEGIALSLDERQRLVADLGPHKSMILRNHGLLTCGETVAEAYMRMNYLNKAAHTQMMAMSATKDLRIPPAEVCELTARQHEGGRTRLGDREWPALMRALDRVDGSWRD